MSEKRTFDCLEVTHVDVYPFKDGVRTGKTKAIADIVLNDQLQLQLRVMNGENGLYVGYPTSQFCKGDEFQSICLPLTSHLHKRIEECVLEKYKSIIKQGA